MDFHILCQRGEIWCTLFADRGLSVPIWLRIIPYCLPLAPLPGTALKILGSLRVSPVYKFLLCCQLGISIQQETILSCDSSFPRAGKNNKVVLPY